MFDPMDFDPAAAMLWPAAAPLPLGEGAPVLLETKSGPAPAEQLQSLLNDMIAEMRMQFDAFRRIRVDADQRLADSQDEAEIKLAKADIKAATDALSLIVRTLEKLDSLQRSLANDRQSQAEQAFDHALYQQMLAEIEAKIADRAQERFLGLCALHGIDPEASTGPPQPA